VNNVGKYVYNNSAPFKDGDVAEDIAAQVLSDLHLLEFRARVKALGLFAFEGFVGLCLGFADFSLGFHYRVWMHGDAHPHVVRHLFDEVVGALLVDVCVGGIELLDVGFQAGRRLGPSNEGSHLQ